MTLEDQSDTSESRSVPLFYTWYRGGPLIKILIVIIFLIVISSFIFTLINLGNTMLNMSDDSSTSMTAIASTTASITLVGVTMGYVILTGELVFQTKLSRDEEREWRENQKAREREILRQSLLHEIKSRDYFDTKSSTESIPRLLFEHNADRLAILDSDEVEAILKYYLQSYTIDESYDEDSLPIRKLERSRDHAIDVLIENSCIDKDEFEDRYEISLTD